jgi:UrcA family protein
MSQNTSTKDAAVSRPSVALLLMACGIVGAMSAGAVSAATPNDDVPALKVRYKADALETDRGAQVLYTRLVHAAEQVCPAEFTGSRLVSESVQRCRDQAVARAVREINNSRLAAVYSATTKRG